MAGRKGYDEEAWYADLCDLMVREQLNFSAAAQALGIKFTSAKEEASHERRQAFKRRYWATRNAHYKQIGGDPSLTKDVVIGVLARTIVQLEERGDYDKVATAAKVMSDIAGWTKDGPQVTVLGNLTQEELNAIKAKARQLGADLDDSKITPGTPN